MKKSEEKNIEAKPEKIVKKEQKIIEEKLKKDYFKIFKDWVIKNSKSIITVLVILIVLILCGKIIGYFNSPEYVANKYFKAIASNNYNDIYNLVELEDSAIVSKDILKEKIDTLDIEAYKIESFQIVNDNALVTYKYENNNKTYYASVLLRKSMKNKFILFNNWKVQSSKVATDVSIKVPTDSIVTIDNIDIKEFIDTKEENYDIYTIDKMVVGEYNIKIELKNGLEVEEKINVSSDQTFVIGNINLEDDIKENLESQLKNDLTILYSNSINNKNYDETGLNKLKNEYQYLKSSLQNKSYTLTNINFNDITVSDVTYDTMLEVTFSINCNYSVNYNLNDSMNSYSGNGTTNIKANFKVENGTYTLESIDNLPINFRIR